MFVSPLQSVTFLRIWRASTRLLNVLICPEAAGEQLPEMKGRLGVARKETSRARYIAAAKLAEARFHRELLRGEA